MLKHAIAHHCETSLAFVLSSLFCPRILSSKSDLVRSVDNDTLFLTQKNGEEKNEEKIIFVSLKMLAFEGSFWFVTKSQFGLA